MTPRSCESRASRSRPIESRAISGAAGDRFAKAGADLRWIEHDAGYTMPLDWMERLATWLGRTNRGSSVGELEDRCPIGGLEDPIVRHHRFPDHDFISTASRMHLLP